MDSDDPVEKAKKLLDAGWHANLAPGSVTHAKERRSGLVEEAVWAVLKDLQAKAPWLPTDPLPIVPSGSW
jgi:hypothetical protein